uniref:Nucleolus and neural progenitor protein-like N-terminal domain-containing protein n=1 Tax=Anopheles farauti TaxID=69004 RepID=A0A182Q341_9DIPT
MHGFRIMRRLNQTLIRIKSLDLVSVIMEFHQFMPDANYIESELNLPVRSNLEYLLVRLQSLTKLLLRVVYLTKEAARYHLKQLTRAFLFHIFSTFLALSGQLWLFARGVCRQTEKFYSELYTALPILPVTKVNWLPEGYVLPCSLAVWLGKEYEQEILYTPPETDVFSLDEGSTLFTLLECHGMDAEDTLLAREENVPIGDNEQQPATFSAVPKNLLLESKRPDTGEVVKRVPIVSNFDPSQLNHIKSKFHVQQFLTQEQKKRKENRKAAITNGITGAKFVEFNMGLMKEFQRKTSADFVKFFKEQLMELLNGRI